MSTRKTRSRTEPLPPAAKDLNNSDAAAGLNVLAESKDDDSSSLSSDYSVDLQEAFEETVKSKKVIPQKFSSKIPGVSRTPKQEVERRDKERTTKKKKKTRTIEKEKDLPVKAHSGMRSMTNTKTRPDGTIKELFYAAKHTSCFPVGNLQELWDDDSETVSLAGIEQVTDMFFITVKKNGLVTDLLTTLDLAGCLHITDYTVFVAASICPNLTNVVLTGCKKLTERSLGSLLNHAKVKDINMMSCDIGIVPEIQDQNKKVNLKGCPVVSPCPKDLKDHMMDSSHFNDKSRFQHFQTMKAVVLRAKHTNCNLLHGLINGKIDPKQEPREFNVNTDNLEVNGKTMRIHYVECSATYLDLVAADNTLYILPYDPSEANVNKEILTVIQHIISKAPHAVFLLGGMDLKGSGTPFSASDLKQTLQQDIMQQISETENSMTEHMLHDQRLIFRNQVSAVNHCHMSELGTSNTFLTNIFFCEKMFSPKMEQADSMNVKKMLKEAMQRVRENHPMYRMLATDLVAMMTSVAMAPGINTGPDIVADLKNKHRHVFGTQPAVYRKILSLMHKFGYLLYIPGNYGDEDLVITDLSWFSGIIHKLNTVRKPAKDVSEDILMVKPETPVLDRGQVRQILQQDMDLKKMHHFKRFLEDTGVLLEDPNTRHLIMTTDIATDPPVPMEHYIDKRSGVLSRKKKIFVFFGLPSALYAALLQQACVLHPPSSLCTSGLVIQHSPLVISVSISEAGTEISLHAETAFPSNIPRIESTKKLFVTWETTAAKLLSNTLGAYQILIEYCLHKWNLPYRVQNLSISGLTRIYESMMFETVSVDHEIIQESEQYVALCNTCGLRPQIISKLWFQLKILHPTFNSEMSLQCSHKVQQSGWTKAQQGSLLKLTKDTELWMTRPLISCCFNTWSVTPVSKASTFSVSLKNLDPDAMRKTLLSLDVAERYEVGKWFKREETEEEKQADAKIPDVVKEQSIRYRLSSLEKEVRQWECTKTRVGETEPAEGTTVTVSARLCTKDVPMPEDIRQEELMVEYTIQAGDVVCTEYAPQSQGWYPVVTSHSEAACDFLVDNSFGVQEVQNTFCLYNESYIETLSKGPPRILKVGMLLECEDETHRKYELCQIKETGDISAAPLINVVGTEINKRMDLSHPRIRPFGYALYLQNNIDPEVIFMIGGTKVDPQKTCKAIVKEMNQYPLPHSFLNKSQINGCPPCHIPKETIQELQFEKSPVFHMSREDTLCSINIYSCQNLRVSMMKRFSDSLLPADVARELPVVWLPPDLDRQDVLYPKLKDMWMSPKDDLHLICGQFGWKTHLNDIGGFRLPESFLDTPEKMMAYSKCKEASLIHLISYIKSKNYVPDHVQLMMSGVKDWDHTVLESKLSRMLELYCSLVGQSLAFEPFKKKLYELVPHSEVKTFAQTMKSVIMENETFKPLMDDGFARCRADRASEITGTDGIPMDSFTSYSHLLTELKVIDNNLSGLPDRFFESFPCLEELHLDDNTLESLPPGVSSCQSLRTLVLSCNKLAALPADFSACKDGLLVLDISYNRFVDLPDVVYECTKLQELRANHIILTDLKEDVGNLQSLRVLKLAGNALKSLPKSFERLVNLEELDLSGVRQFEFPKSASSQDHGVVLSKLGLTALISKYPIFLTMEKEMEELFDSCDTTGVETLYAQTLKEKFNPRLYDMFSRFQGQSSDTDMKDPSSGGCPPEIFSLSKLTVLDLSYQGITTVTDRFSVFKSLEELVLSDNPKLMNIDGGLSSIKTIKAIALKNCPQLKTPPKEIVNRGFKAIYGYLKRLMMGSVECRRTKLMMVGLGGAGKTSLVRVLKKTKNTEKTEQHDFDSHLKSRYGDKYEKEGITDGIDITDWKSGGVTFSMWDFAGQTVYYNTHQFFMSNRAVYLLLWNIRLGYEHAGLDFWLSSIACHAPRAPILVIGTHCDQVEKFWLPVENIQTRYPQVIGFHTISCNETTPQGIEGLAAQIVSVALKEKYMGERIPEAWLNLETRMLREKKEKDSLLLTSVADLAQDCGIVDSSELGEAVQFLHDLGSVQHFQNVLLKSRVVINPQWIVDAMACVVSVHDTPIKDGILSHKDIGKIWKKFDKNFHSWLLRLTEEFDLTFPLKDQEANVVPCLLSEAEPPFTWPDLASQPGNKEAKMLYKFDYLPAGLFNRAQVRLYQFSDSSTIWKKGSLLKKNGHLALLKQKDNTVHLRVQGPRPENVTFMVHEVFEGLVIESFNGVTYDYFLPCTDCMKGTSQDPSLFPASKIRRATELKAPFLQCDNLFHTLSLHELHAVMPPDNSKDYDIHLERSLHELDDLKDDLSYDVFMIYNKKDVPSDPRKKVAPQKMKEDLEANGFKVWFPSDPSEIDLQRISVTLKEAKLVVVCVSSHFVSDTESCRLFYYVKQNLRKNLQLVVVGDSMKWKESEVGMLCSTEVYVNMTDISRYPAKLKELLSAVREGIMKKAVTSLGVEPPECFISYCWSNSADAVQKGTKGKETSLGYGDPRKFKNYLEENGIGCWLDIEKVGKSSLFEDIAQGLRHAKVMIACLSDEYCSSTNCIMEFRFASITLKIPIVVAVVGRGYEWVATEVGMLSMGLPRVSLQYETGEGLKPLLEAVQKHLPQVDLIKAAKLNQMPAANNNQLAFQELLEVAQRKFLRQVVLYADSMETSHYPRLILMDYLREEEKHEHVKDDKGEGDSSTRPPSSASHTRPMSSKSHRLIKRKTSTLSFANEALEAASQVDYCVRFMCEYEEGWHVTGTYLPLPVDPADWEDFLDSVAPYMARLYAIVKHTSVSLPVLDTEKGDILRKKIIDKCSLESEFKNEYVIFRKMVMETDADRSKGLLARCHMPSGKVLWLCEEHQKLERVTVLPDDVQEITMETEEDDSKLPPDATEVSQQGSPSVSAGVEPDSSINIGQNPSHPIPQSRQRKVAPPAPNKAPASRACIVM